MLQSEHKNKLNFCLHKHHLLFVRLARICFLRYTPTDMLLADENRVAPRFRQSTSLKYADRKSTRLNSSHVRISYAVFCLKKKKKKKKKNSKNKHQKKKRRQNKYET